MVEWFLIKLCRTYPIKTQRLFGYLFPYTRCHRKKLVKKLNIENTVIVNYPDWLNNVLLQVKFNKLMCD